MEEEEDVALHLPCTKDEENSEGDLKLRLYMLERPLSLLLAKFWPNSCVVFMVNKAIDILLRATNAAQLYLKILKQR